MVEVRALITRDSRANNKWDSINFDGMRIGRKGNLIYFSRHCGRGFELLRNLSMKIDLSELTRKVQSTRHENNELRTSSRNLEPFEASVGNR